MVGVGVLVASVVGGLVLGPALRARKPATASASGALVYRVNCASCHGPEGRGDGTSGEKLRPPPRDFSARPWRFDPSKDSIAKVVADGIPGTAMASFKAGLSPTEIDAVSEYVAQLATSRPTVPYQPPVETALAQAAAFTEAYQPAPPLLVSDAHGKPSRLIDRGGKLVLVHFWAIDCAHCLKEMPALLALENRFRDRGFEVLHICTDANDAAAAQAIAEKAAPGIRVVVDEAGSATSKYEVQALPAVWLVSPAGDAVARATGARNWSAPEIANLIEHWLPAPPAAKP